MKKLPPAYLAQIWQRYTARGNPEHKSTQDKAFTERLMRSYTPDFLQNLHIDPDGLQISFFNGKFVGEQIACSDEGLGVWEIRFDPSAADFFSLYETNGVAILEPDRFIGKNYHGVYTYDPHGILKPALSAAMTAFCVERLGDFARMDGMLKTPNSEFAASVLDAQEPPSTYDIYQLIRGHESAKYSYVQSP